MQKKSRIKKPGPKPGQKLVDEQKHTFHFREKPSIMERLMEVSDMPTKSLAIRKTISEFLNKRRNSKKSS